MTDKNFTITLGQYKGLKRAPISTEVTESEVQAAIAVEQQKRAKLHDVERPAASGDTVVMDFAGYLGEEQFEGGTSQNYALELGSHTFIPGFEEQLIGASAGDEVSVNVTFPENYPAANLAGHPVIFLCTVHKVQEHRKPELNDLFGKLYGFPSFAAFKDNVRTTLASQKEAAGRSRVQNELLEQIVASSDIELTDVFVDAFIEQMLMTVTQDLARQGATLEQYLQYRGITDEQLRTEMRPNAEKTGKASAALAAIADAEGITVSNEDIDNDIRRMAAMYQMEYEKLNSTLDENARESIRNSLTIGKALRLVFDSSVEE